MRRPLTLAALVGVLLASSVAAPGAVALQPGVYISPGSPTAKEYSFPLSALRAAANGHGTVPGAIEPLFGVGITAGTAPGLRGSVPRGVTRGGGSSGRITSRPGTTSKSSGSAHANAPQGRALASLVRPRSSFPQEALIGIPLLLAGLALGIAIVAIRRRSG